MNFKSLWRRFKGGFPVFRLKRTATINLAAGYYILKTTAEPTNPVPSSPLWVTTTTKLSDVGANDHTTEEAVSISGVGTVGTIEVLYVHTAAATFATYATSLRYGQEGPTPNAYYWDGSAWQSWDTFAITPHLGMDFEDYARNPADRNALYLLFTFTCTGGGLESDYAVTNLVPAT